MENQIACVLASKGLALHYYDRKSRQQLDFVLANNGKNDVVDVKSGKDYHRHVSLDAAMRDFADRIGRSIVFEPCNIECADGETYLPLCMSMFL